WVLVVVDLADDSAPGLHRPSEENVDRVRIEARVPDRPKLRDGRAQNGRQQHIERRLADLLRLLENREPRALQRLDALGLPALPEADEHDLLTAEALEGAVHLAEIGPQQSEVLQPLADQLQ